MRLTSLYTILFFLVVCISCTSEKAANTNVEPVPSSSKDVKLSPEKISGNVEKGRDSWQKPMLIIDKMGDLDGQTVADIGAYYGYFTFLTAYQGAKVIAVDIDNDKLRFIRNIAENESNPVFKNNIDYRLVLPDDPSLKNEEVDQILFVDMLEYLVGEDYSKNYFTKLQKGLKPGGQINIVDFKMKRIPENIEVPKANRVYADVVEELLYELGFVNIVVDDTTLDYQYIITAQKSK